MVSFATREGSQVPFSQASAGCGASSGLKPDNFRFWSARAAPLGSGAPLASLSQSILSGLGRPGKEGGRAEPATGYEFPLEYCYLRTKQCPSLAGLGVRSKRIVIKDINVYALGIYVDATAARSSLAAFKKRPAEDLERDQAFYDAVVSSPNVEKTLRLVISSRLVDNKKFVEALEEQLVPRLKKAGEPGAIDAFRNQFDRISFSEGMEVVFSSTDNKNLAVKVAGEQKGVICSPALCSSLFDIYLGSDPVSKDAKATFGRSLAAALKEDK
ncbi:hypothetical protein Agub_g13590 [Astrephomene gubernaculifera]|uniref:Chalcone-flavonone isomerase family protein n=1 Tax=Astrephomene gubernaculifera TaxID=47775 RepID=A0AAD3HSG7_9CHLO|nr:hypothetical protein Agub_g13590 [Astrephomene gubernaculifera]